MIYVGYGYSEMGEVPCNIRISSEKGLILIAGIVTSISWRMQFFNIP